MKELATPINITRPPNPGIEIPNIQLTTICDDGRWYNRDGNGKYYNKQHPIHIIWNGANEEDRKKAEKFVVSAYRHGREILADESTVYEMQKTPTDIQIIKQVGWSVYLFAKFFGGEPSRKQDLNRFHFLKPGSLEKIFKGKTKNAFFDPFGHCIALDRSPSDVITAVRIGHEEFHRESPISLQVVEGKTSIYRTGLMTLNPDGTANLDETDEALTAELNYQLFKKNKENPLFEKELKAVEKINPWIKEVKENKILGKTILLKNIDLEDIYTIVGAKEVLEILESHKSKDYKIAYMADVIENPKENCRLETFERSQEWTDFSNFSYRLITKSKDEIKTRWEVIDMFAQVKFAPNEKFPEKLVHLRKTIDRILGEGSFDELK